MLTFKTYTFLYNVEGAMIILFSISKMIYFFKQDWTKVFYFLFLMILTKLFQINLSLYYKNQQS